MSRWFQVAGAVAAASFSFSAQAEKKPNFIFLLADDQAFNALGCNGNHAIKTPHIDRMARDGVNFTNAFVTTSICVVSRASILTGQYMRTHGIRDFNLPLSDDQMAHTYPGVLRRNGYFTGFTGKWGIAAEIFNYDMHADQFDFWRGQNEQDQYWKDGRDGTHQNVRMSDDADDFLALAKESGKPFCLSISYKAPHGPWDQCEPDIFESINQSGMPVPETFTEEAWNSEPPFIQEGINGNQAQIARAFKFGPNPTDSHHQRLMAQYYALIQGMDASIGRIRRSLKKYGFDDNTVLIFFSDNGYHIHEHGLHGKWLMYEPSIRVPCVVYDPRLPQTVRGQVRDEVVLNIDLAPTMLSLAGVKSPDRMQGADVSPLLRGEKPEWRQELFYEHTYTEAWPRELPKSIGVRTEEWKYIRYVSERPVVEQLFNLQSDPHELKNLAASPEHRQVLEHLRKRTDAYRKEIPDNRPDYQEYADEYIVRKTGRIIATNPVQFSGVQSLGQTFKAETGHLTCVELMLPTWGKGEGPCDVKAELEQDGRLLKTVMIDKEDIENTRIQRLTFDVPVEKGNTLYLRLIPTGSVPKSTLAWWAYEEHLYRDGCGFADDMPRPYSHEMTMVFKQSVCKN
jgi:arylsulfatase A-like enzyme